MIATGLLKLLTTFTGALPDGDGSSCWMPPQGSTVAQGVAWWCKWFLARSVFF